MRDQKKQRQNERKFEGEKRDSHFDNLFGFKIVYFSKINSIRLETKKKKKK